MMLKLYIWVTDDVDASRSPTLGSEDPASSHLPGLVLGSDN